MIVDYLVGRDAGADPALPTDSALAALQEAKKKPAKYKLAEVLANLVLSPDRGNSWNAVRSLRSLAAAVVRAIFVKRLRYNVRLFPHTTGLIQF